MSRVVSIYGLFDPREPDHIRYIGKTVGVWNGRRRAHINEARERTDHKGKRLIWIRSLLAEGIQLGVVLLFITNEDNWETVERTLVKIYRMEGHDLLNVHRGGSWYKGGKNRGYIEPESDEIKQARIAKCIATRMANGSYKRDEDSIRRGIETKKERGLPLNGFLPGTRTRSEESKQKARETSVSNGTYGTNQFTGKTAEEKEELAKKNAGSFGNKPLSPEIIRKRAETLKRKNEEKRIRLEVKVIFERLMKRYQEELFGIS
jgi:hypothetical protein